MWSNEGRRRRRRQDALSGAAEEHDPDVLDHRLMDPKGAQAVLDVFSQSSPEVAKANIDVSKTYTNKYVEQANQKLGRA
jgi:hypothetical protein